MKKRETFYKWFFLAGDRFRVFMFWINGLCRFFLVISLVMFLLCFIYFIGFNYSPETSEGLLSAFRIIFIVIFLSKYIPELARLRKTISISLVFRSLMFIYSLFVFLANFNLVNHEKNFWHPFYGNTSIIIAIALLAITEMSGLLKLLNTKKIPPALIFSSSFLLVILIGSGLLLLPRSHQGQLSVIDSLFTSVSAVCVTGLVVVDTATEFTLLGKIIILGLIQVGGLGIMTFTGFFSYIFTASGSSFRDRFLLKEIFSAESLNNLFKLLAKIVILTFLTEFAGALIIYFSLNWQVEDRLMFSVFHSVSAFCNAGFSTLTEGLYSPEVRNNYNIQVAVAVLVILGGIGFPVLVSVYSYIKRLIIIFIRKIQGSRIPLKPGKKNISTRLVLIMTGTLILAGAALYYFLEKNTSLEGYDDTRKIIASFFGSISARTAGFNMVDISLWSYPTVFLMILLMWIGASPGSTGGGIKTTTFALAFRSVWNNIRGTETLILGNREVSRHTISRILAIIFLSLIIIAAGFFCLLLSEPEKNPVHLFFECVSAFGTVGLSLADTGSFSNPGKIIVMLLMFIGRVGPLTLFTGLMISNRKSYSRYPELEIIIN